MRREEVDAQLKTALEQLLQSQLDAIRPLDAKVSSVEDDKKKFEEEDKHDGERLARMRVTADEYLKKFEDLEKEREKLLEEYETKRYLSVKTAHLKVCKNRHYIPYLPSIPSLSLSLSLWISKFPFPEQSKLITKPFFFFLV